MARPLRIERAGAWYHVTGRGLERRVLFRDAKDRFHWLELLGEATELWRLRVQAKGLRAGVGAVFGAEGRRDGLESAGTRSGRAGLRSRQHRDQAFRGPSEGR